MNLLTKLSAFFISLLVIATAQADNPKDSEKYLNTHWRDTSIPPNADFFTYANGQWQKNNPIPEDQSTWNFFAILNQKTQDNIHQMLTDLAKNKSIKPGSIDQKVGDYYYSGMNEEEINRLGVQPLKPQFDLIDSIKTVDDLQKVITQLHMIGVDILFDVGSMQDFMDSTKMIAAASQGGLGLPDRDYYLKTDKKFETIRQAYLEHITKMFVLLGDKPDKASEEAKTVMAIETTLAKASMSRVDQRDPHAIYHMMDMKQVQALTPLFSWQNYMKGIGLSEVKTMNVAMPDFFKAMNQSLQTISLDDWKVYLRGHLIEAYASCLSSPFVTQNFWMNSKLSGAKQLLPRWRRVVSSEDAALGFAIGKIYVKRYFSEKDKNQVLEILHNIRQVLQEDLKTLPWMTPQTREAALKKLAMIEERVGFPDKWWDYSALKVDRGPYVLNVMRATTFLIQRDLKKIGKPVDRSEWAMTPQTINAYYDPSMNNINIPAGILQPPFFDPKAPASVNYGGIGFIMGHELTHGFDDQGAQFDGHGNLKDWWTAEDLKKFKEATNCIVTQYSSYKVDGDLPVQGKLVVGEATADLGGVTLAYRAYHASKAFKEAKIIDGFTPDQQFFLSVAHVWAGNIRPEALRASVTTDPHPPMMFRVNGTLANMPSFYEAFSVSEPGPMRNQIPCRIW